jgi:hypothetical protein
MVLECERFHKGHRMGVPHKRPAKRVRHEVQDIHVYTGEKHMGQRLAARLRLGVPGLEYIKYVHMQHVDYALYYHNCNNMTSISASLSNEELIASVALHLGKEEHDAGAFWASSLDTQKQAVQFSMSVLTGMGHKEVLSSLKEWHLDANLGGPLPVCLKKRLMHPAEPISPKDLITWMEFQDDLDVCGQLNRETYVRAYFRL